MPSPQTKQQLHPVLTVSQLTDQIKGVVEQLFDNVYVVGEVSNAKAYPSGHWYFSLKDKDATLSCVCFRSANAAIKFKLEDGLMLVAQGNVSVYPPKGGYQLVASKLEPVGIGEWQLAFDQLRAALEKEGLLDPARKKPIPTMPRRVGVVTSPAAAALRDILSALARRNQNVNVVIAPTRVQGEGSAEEIAQAIRDLQEIPGIDVIIVARGGGSIEDLWSFNTDVVARAVAACPIPIVSGVGHETDITICDLVADLRAPTPTAAAELVAKGSLELIEKYQNLEQRLVFKVEQRLSRARRQVERLSPTNALTRYQGRLKQYQMRVGHDKVSIERSVVHLMRNLQHRWQQKHEKLLALAPTNVLNRGFAILRKLDGTVVCDPMSVQPGEEVQAILKTGSLFLQVSSVQNSQQSEPDPRRYQSSQLTENEFSPDEGEMVAHLQTEVISHYATSEVSSDASILLSSQDSSAPISELPLFENCPRQDAEVPAQELVAAETSGQDQDRRLESLILVSHESVVFDAELADPAVLAKIFGEELADFEATSSIFRAKPMAQRLELDALNAELTKDSVPALTPLEVRARISPTVGKALAADNLYETAESTNLPEGGAHLVSELAEIDAAITVRSLVPTAAPAGPTRHKPSVNHKSGKRPIRAAAAHQLSLFQRSDDD